jgi:hypothetical protein
LMTVNHMAVIYDEMGDYARALELYQVRATNASTFLGLSQLDHTFC